MFVSTLIVSLTYFLSLASFFIYNRIFPFYNRDFFSYPQVLFIPSTCFSAVKPTCFERGMRLISRRVLKAQHLRDISLFTCYDKLWRIWINANIIYVKRNISYKAPFIWRKVVPDRRVTRLAEPTSYATVYMSKVVPVDRFKVNPTKLFIGPA